MCEKFDQSMVKLGYSAFDPDTTGHLIAKLYANTQYVSLMEYIIMAYRNSCGGDVLEELYALMLSNLQHDFDE